MLDPSTHLYQLDSNCEKIQYESDHWNKTKMPSFWLTLKLPHALDGLFSVLVYLGCMDVNIKTLFAEGSITERDVTTFRYYYLGDSF